MDLEPVSEKCMTACIYALHILTGYMPLNLFKEFFVHFVQKFQIRNKMSLVCYTWYNLKGLKNWNILFNYRIFNTNNLWIKLEGIARLVKSEGIEMEIIVNLKVKLEFFQW